MFWKGRWTAQNEFDYGTEFGTERYRRVRYGTEWDQTESVRLTVRNSVKATDRYGTELIRLTVRNSVKGTNSIRKGMVQNSVNGTEFA